ncbi:hypothetical protein SCOR_15080 [Sulfidibacter corallicola]|uniref:Uncharacterized protein n=1 Tax=Sulfidibacter corallicola TaxID=2818388 RepID=A0A8A4TYA6_SULCO|nr:hypothetical protein [Sulfidibacter corallicola]QTD54208.1 hypothetical protein J3U87_17320 [Sulfidibacter corallicola]
MPENNVPRYWDIEPKHIRQSFHAEGVCVPITVRGAPRGSLVVQSLDSSVATVEGGWIRLGQQVGATMILVSDSAAGDSMRYIQVEVFDPGSGGTDPYGGGDIPPDWGI